MRDGIMGIRKLLPFNVIDNCTQEALALRSLLHCSPNALLTPWIALSHGVASILLSELTTALSSLPKNLSSDAWNMKLRFSLFNLLGPCRTVTPKDSTACTAKNL